jgi:hypothetical protein
MKLPGSTPRARLAEAPGRLAGSAEWRPRWDELGVLVSRESYVPTE